MFLDTLVEQVSRGKKPVLREIAEACGLHPVTISKWNRRLEFRLELAECLRRACSWLVEAAHTAQLQVAISGSLPHYQTQLRRLGLESPFVDPANPQASAPGMQSVNGVQIHIHGIPEPAPRSTLPPPLELPATPSATSSTTPAK